MLSPDSMIRITNNSFKRQQNEDYVSLLTSDNVSAWTVLITEMEPELIHELSADYSLPDHIPEEEKMELYFYFELCCYKYIHDCRKISQTLFLHQNSILSLQLHFSSILVCELLKKDISDKLTQYDQAKEIEIKMAQIFEAKHTAMMNKISKCQIQEVEETTYCGRCLEAHDTTERLKIEYQKTQLQLLKATKEIAQYKILMTTVKNKQKKRPMERPMEDSNVNTQDQEMKQLKQQLAEYEIQLTQQNKIITRLRQKKKKSKRKNHENYKIKN